MTFGIVRITKRLRDHFAERPSEWGFALGLTMWGALALLPGTSWTTASSELLLRTLTEVQWGIAAVIVGGSRIVMLFINGTYRRVSSWARGGLAFLSLFFWVTIALSYYVGGRWPPALGLVLAIIIVDYINVRKAMGEAARADVDAQRKRADNARTANGRI